MPLTVPTYADKVWRRLPLERRPDAGDIESSYQEALKRVSRNATNASYRPALETTVNVTLSAADAGGKQSGPLPATIVQESIRTRDVTHADLTRPLEKKETVGELTYIRSDSALGYFAVADGKLHARKNGTALATGTPAVVRAVLLLTSLADVPVEIEDIVIDAGVSIALESLGGDEIESVPAGVVAEGVNV